MNLNPFIKPQRRERTEPCRIKIKPGKDGSMTKEISGNCTPAQLEALKKMSTEDSAPLQFDDD